MHRTGADGNIRRKDCLYESAIFPHFHSFQAFFPFCHEQLLLVEAALLLLQAIQMPRANTLQCAQASSFLDLPMVKDQEMVVEMQNCFFL